jgi:phosphonate transport system permease protein
MWSLRRVTAWFFIVALVCLCLSDIAVISADPWSELSRMAMGFALPSFFSWPELLKSLINTLAFALIGVAVAAALGLVLARFFHWRVVRVFCAFIRSVHELFWALFFLQIFGLQTLTGLLAIIIPFTGIFTKVYAEILEEADQKPLQSLPANASNTSSAYLYARLAVAWPQLVMYTRYRLECGIRSSAILGFVGLPTLGFHLESFFKQGDYAEAAGVLYVFFLMIATLKFWSHRRSLSILLIFSLFALPFDLTLHTDSIQRFLTQDILPSPLRYADTWWNLEVWKSTLEWSAWLFSYQIQEGVWNTLLLTMVALVGSGVVTLILYPFVSPLFFGKGVRWPSHLFLVVMRSLPELMLAFIVVVMIGPSMLPAIIALSLHNGAIIAHLLGQWSREIQLRQDAAKGVNLYLYEVTPRLYRPFLAFLFYRWEVILRESAILGILGIHTLGFYVDSAFEELRFDRAFFLILVCALLNIMVDAGSRFIRNKLRLTTLPEIP